MNKGSLCWYIFLVGITIIIISAGISEFLPRNFVTDAISLLLFVVGFGIVLFSDFVFKKMPDDFYEKTLED